MNPVRISKLVNAFHGEVKNRYTIWQIRQELAILEHDKRFAPRVQSERRVLMALKSRNDLQILEGKRPEDDLPE